MVRLLLQMKVECWNNLGKLGEAALEKREGKRRVTLNQAEVKGSHVFLCLITNFSLASRGSGKSIAKRGGP